MGNQVYLNGITLEELAEALKPLMQAHSPLQSSQPDQADDLLTREETQKLLRISKTTLWKYTKAGKLSALGIGDRIYYKRSAVLAALQPLV